MNKKYLDNKAMTHFWQRVKQTFVIKEDGKVLSSNDYTDRDQASLISMEKKMDSFSEVSTEEIDALFQ